MLKYLITITFKVFQFLKFDKGIKCYATDIEKLGVFPCASTGQYLVYWFICKIVLAGNIGGSGNKQVRRLW